MNFREALLAYSNATGVSLYKIAQRSDVSYEMLKKIKQRETSSMNVDDANKVIASLGSTLERFLSGDFEGLDTVAVAGRVGAGDEVPLADAYAKGAGLYHVARPSELAGKQVVAVEIEGTSMLPTYAPGDLIFYTRENQGVTVDVLGRVCICETADGNAYLKTVRQGDAVDRFNLYSLNIDTPIIRNANLKWAAKIILHQDAEVAIKIDI